MLCSDFLQREGRGEGYETQETKQGAQETHKTQEGHKVTKLINGY